MGNCVFINYKWKLTDSLYYNNILMINEYVLLIYYILPFFFKDNR